MINQKIKVFFLVCLSVIFISKAVNANEEDTQRYKRGQETKKPIRFFSGLDKDQFHKKTVEETFLDDTNVNGLGLVAIEKTNFPDNLWSNSSERVLTKKINEVPDLSLATTNKIFKRLLLVESPPPLNAIGIENMGYSFLLSRIDKLINLGAIEEAEEILNYIKKPSIELMKRKIHVALINGRLNKTCDLADKYPNFEGMLQFRIICLVRKNDWQAAALVFTAGSSLQRFSEIEKELLLNFLDPEFNYDYSYKFGIEDLSPVVFYLLHGKKAIKASNRLPYKYAYAFSRPGIAQSVRIRSMEQLASKYVINSNTLFGFYRSYATLQQKDLLGTEKALIELNKALNSQSEYFKLNALIKATKEFHQKNLIVQFCYAYRDRLKILIFSKHKKLSELSKILLSLVDGIENKSVFSTSENPELICLINIKNSVFVKYEFESNLCQLVKKLNVETIRNSFPKKENYDEQLETGLIMLQSLSLLKNGVDTKFNDLELSLSLLTKIGLIDLVNEISIELLALKALKKMDFL